MEKKRRARINSCLDELKSLILDAMKKDVSIKKMERDKFSIVLS
jgi:hairy-and-enhancer-of-split protein